ncbi:cytidine deaminase family protein [Fructobacillus fructosus]|uniref:Cytidine deaminase (Cdd) n=1 Tax=Fructobacillus fructosus TaxID=1631 RepID=A0ABN9YQM4_9LACO|nr:cytidine deaminase [Fructobacillus fructosus]MBC9119022.1 cytidine deaminase [Fructobacillus fructosus]MBD9365750.1 cytidine deaminase [Leuconostoc mesenteroides]MCK8638601.1 cytidine deaminase [Fructobacillus fructosus]CAK1238077.1 Cytidine deaminase (Cdd) [Fructobacillus fructosus]
MDKWEELYLAAKPLYKPHDVSPFIYAQHVVTAIEAENGEIFTGFCFEATAGVFHLCAERAAAFNMFQSSGQTKIKRIMTFRDHVPVKGDSMPCGACREFLLQLDVANSDIEFMVDYQKRSTVTLAELMPHWWGEQRLTEED